jgi:type I restriction-modification system DNA methylase subunit
MARARSPRSNNSSANGFEQKLWLAADKLRSNMDAAEDTHIVLVFMFLKYISDSFEEYHANPTAGEGNTLAVMPKIPTNTTPRTFSGFRAPRAGPTCKAARSSQPFRDAFGWKRSLWV